MSIKYQQDPKQSQTMTDCRFLIAFHHLHVYRFYRLFICRFFIFDFCFLLPYIDIYDTFFLTCRQLKNILKFALCLMFFLFWYVFIVFFFLIFAYYNIKFYGEEKEREFLLALHRIIVSSSFFHSINV